MKTTAESSTDPRTSRGRFRPAVLLLAASLTSCSAAAPPPTNAPPTASAVVHPPGSYVTVGGVKLWVEIEGTGEPLLLIAGGPGQSHYFHPSFSALADTARVITFDAFGRGKSDRARSPSEYTFERDVEIVEGLRVALGLERWSVLGHSYGGMVAQGYALAHPDRVTKLVLANTFIDGLAWQAANDICNEEVRNLWPEIWAATQEVRGRGLRSSSAEHQRVYRIPPGLCSTRDPLVIARLPPGYVANNPDVAYSIQGDDGDFSTGGSIAPLDFRPRLEELTVPVLILAGRYDRWSPPRLSRQFQTHAPRAEFVLFEQAGHVPFLEIPDELFEVLRAFLKGKPLPAKR